MSAKEILENKIPQKIIAKPDVVKSINALVLFDLTGEGGGRWSIDFCNPAAPVLVGDCANPQVTLTMSATDFESMVGGQLNAQQAFLTGKLKVKGDMGTALKLGAILS